MEKDPVAQYRQHCAKTGTTPTRTGCLTFWKGACTSKKQTTATNKLAVLKQKAALATATKPTPAAPQLTGKDRTAAAWNKAHGKH